ncbi:hypothetical protein BDF21DRAFT_398896 [Thamnidium elegans]|nr:hypothetical protein BDF21DRAFT_398896 [Thamnidium elegans]
MSPRRLYTLWSGRYIKRLDKLREDLPIEYSFAPIPKFDDRFVRQNRYEPPPRILLDAAEVSSLKIITRHIENSGNSIVSTSDESDFDQSSESLNTTSPVSTENTFDYDYLDAISIFLYSLYYKKDSTKNTVVYVVIFQAIIKHPSPEQFSVYFEARFSKFAIKPETFLGMIKYFPADQREQEIFALLFNMLYS